MKIVLLFVLLYTALPIAPIQGYCSIYYLKEPPAQLDCNPFDTSTNPPQWITSLLCIAVVQLRLVNETFSISWHHTDTNGITTNFTNYTLLNNQLGIALFDNLNSKPFDESLLGEYYCQITSTEIPLVPSRTVLLLSPWNYTGLPQCPPIIIDSKQRCAEEDLFPTSTTVSITSPINSTITPSVITPSVITPSVITPSVSSSSSTGWIIGLTLVSLLVLILLVVVFLLLVVYKKTHKMDTVKGMPIIYRRKKKPSFQPPPMTFENLPVVEELPGRLSQEPYDYVDWKRECSIQGSSSLVASSRRNEPLLLQKSVEGKLYAIADLHTRDNSSTYQNIHK